MDIKKIFYAEHYPKEPSAELIKIWEDEKVKFDALSEEVKAKFAEDHAKVKTDEEKKEGALWRL